MKAGTCAQRAALVLGRGVMYTVYTCIPGVYLYTYTPPTTAVYQLYTWQGRVHMRGWCIPVYLSQQYTARYTGKHRPAGPRYTTVPTIVLYRSP